MDTIETVAAVVGRCVHKHGGGTPMKIRTDVGPRYRPMFVKASAYAIDRGWIALRDGLLVPGAVDPPARGALGDLAAQIQAATTSAGEH